MESIYLLNYYLFKRKLNLLKFFSTLISRIKCSLWNIKIGQNSVFFGIPIIKRIPHSYVEIGSNVTFRSDSKSNLIGINRKCTICTLRKGAKIKIGSRCGFSGTVIASANQIEIGENVLCGANTLITDTDWHPVEAQKRWQRIKEMPSKPIEIRDNVWLGANVIVLKGVSIGKNSIITPNSVINKSIPANVIAGGNPCKVIKQLLDGDCL